MRLPGCPETHPEAHAPRRRAAAPPRRRALVPTHQQAACLAGCAVWRSRRVGSATESLGFGALAGLSGATSISFAKLCW